MNGTVGTLNAILMGLLYEIPSQVLKAIWEYEEVKDSSRGKIYRYVTIVVLRREILYLNKV